MIRNRDYHIQDDHDVYEGTLIRTSLIRTSLRSNEYKYKFNNLSKLEIRLNQPSYYRRINGEKIFRTGDYFELLQEDGRKRRKSKSRKSRKRKSIKRKSV